MKKNNINSYQPGIQINGSIGGEISPSCHIYTTLIDGNPFHIGLDCGRKQGSDVTYEDLVSTGLSIIPHILLLSHSHIDHVGGTPVLVKEGFNGSIFGTKETNEGSKINLKDAFRIDKNNYGHFLRQKETITQKDLLLALNYVDNYQKGHIMGEEYYDSNAAYSEYISQSKNNLQGVDINIFKDPGEVAEKYMKLLEKHGIKSRDDIDSFSCKGMPFEYEHLFKTINLFKEVEFHKPFVVAEGKDNKLTVEYVPAGHILGSAQIVIRDDVFGTTWYSGDVGGFRNTGYIGSPALKTTMKIDNVNRLILESTYADKDHPDKNAETMAMFEFIERTQNYILIAVFANDRSQVIMKTILDAISLLGRDLKKNIIVDGFTNSEYTKLYTTHPGFATLADNDRIIRASGRGYQKAASVPKGSIIISSSGMMTGGPINNYKDLVLQDPKSGLIITGYQSEGTAGYDILKTGRYLLGGVTKNVNCEIFHCKSFSSHAGKTDLLRIAETHNADDIYLVHGELSSQQKFKNLLFNKGIGQRIHMPNKKNNTFLFK